MNFSDLKVGDVIEFGSYPYEKDGTKQPVKWNVIAIDNGFAQLLCTNIIEYS